jgi:glycosyltransferase involved in cell wall biosynthesis
MIREASRRTPIVSIGLPVYNGQAYLRQALDSLLCQSLSDFELIISDNASTDGTEAIARDYAARDSRLRYIRQPQNIGVSRNFNATFHIARGRYFKWSAVDDLVAPIFLERCTRILDGDPAIVAAFARTALIGPAGERLGDSEDSLHVVQDTPSARLAYVFARLGRCDMQYGLIRATVLARTSLLKGFVGSDIALIGELALHGKLFEIPEVLFFRRLHPAALTNLDGIQHAATYGAGQLSGFSLRRCRLVFEHAKAVVKAPISLDEKIRSMSRVIHKVSWDRSLLTSELTNTARELLRSTRITRN